jgi:hypothetical protein
MDVGEIEAVATSLMRGSRASDGGCSRPIAVRSGGMITILSALVSMLSFRFRSRASLELEFTALRHQLILFVRLSSSMRRTSVAFGPVIFAMS